VLEGAAVPPPRAACPSRMPPFSASPWRLVAWASPALRAGLAIRDLRASAEIHVNAAGVLAARAVQHSWEPDTHMPGDVGDGAKAEEAPSPTGLRASAFAGDARQRPNEGKAKVRAVHDMEPWETLGDEYDPRPWAPDTSRLRDCILDFADCFTKSMTEHEWELLCQGNKTNLAQWSLRPFQQCAPVKDRFPSWFWVSLVKGLGLEIRDRALKRCHPDLVCTSDPCFTLYALKLETDPLRFGKGVHRDSGTPKAQGQPELSSRSGTPQSSRGRSATDASDGATSAPTVGTKRTHPLQGDGEAKRRTQVTPGSADVA